jgi:hypothetical protein
MTESQDATKVSAAFPEVCDNLYGVSGWCRLNESGDRAIVQFDIWGYVSGTTAPSVSIVLGSYDPYTRTTTWY